MMFKNLTIKRKLIIIIIGTILAVSMINIASYVYALDKLSTKNIQYFKDKSFEKDKKSLQNYSDMAITTIQVYYDRASKYKNQHKDAKDIDTVTEKLKKEALEAIKHKRYGENGYFWINDMDYKMIMHPIKPEFDNKKFINTPKVPFVELGVNQLKKSGKDSDFIQYSFLTPSTGKYSHKLSIVNYFRPWNWVIGTGLYTDYIDKEFEKQQIEIKHQIKKMIINSAITALALIIIILLIINYISHQMITKPIIKFEKGLLDFFKFINKEQTSVPMLEANGKDEISLMSKVVNQNVKKTQLLIEQDEAFIKDVKEVVKKVKDGDLSVRVEKSTENETLEELKIILNDMLEILSKSVDTDINKITKSLNTYKELDFTHKIENPTGDIAKGLNELTNIINKLLLGNFTNGSKLEKNAKYLLENVIELNNSSHKQKNSLDKTSSSVSEITKTIIQSTKNISDISEYSDKLTELVETGQELAKMTVDDINNIDDQTEAIVEAIANIDKITLQTKILSLNASVEASTAGEAGKSFSVVALEVRDLANKTAKLAKHIKKLVEDAKIKTNRGKLNADKMIGGYNKIFDAINEATMALENISISSKNQEFSIKQINEEINRLKTNTENNSQIADKTKQIANSTNEIAKIISTETKEAKFMELS